MVLLCFEAGCFSEIMQQRSRFHQTEIDQDGHIDGQLRPTGVVPTFMDRFTQASVDIDIDVLFSPRWA